jgi:hypothetical protein
MGLIKNKKEIVEEKPQEATALAIANARMREAPPGPVNILRVEDPSEKTGVATYFVLKLREDSAILCELVGFKAGKTQINAINSFEDVVNYVEKGSVKVVNIRIPWTRIVSIENITYKHKKQ